MSRKFSTSIDLLGNRVVNVGDASSATDAVTLQQLQALTRGASWKAAARAASTANVSLSAPGASIDGVTLVSGDIILLKNQTAGSENGLYTWTGSSAALTRTTDADTAAKLRAATVFITEGTSNADKAFNQTADNITLGTTTLNWVQFGGASAPYIAGNGLSLTGQTFAVVPGVGIVADGTSTRIDTAVVVRKYASTIGDGSTTVFNVTHNLGTTDIQITARALSVFQGLAVGERFEVDEVTTSANVVQVTFGTAPPSNSVRIIVQG